MQTFLPLPGLCESAEALRLDYRRLGKQRVEVLQLLKAIKGESPKGWVNHPATKMWRQYPDALCDYGMAVCYVWKSLGYRDTCYEKIAAYHSMASTVELPWWLGWPEFHEAHRSNLVRKNEDFRALWPDVRDDLPYIWPEEKA